MTPVKKMTRSNLEAELNNASPLRVVQLLFEGLMARIMEARGAIEHKDFFKKAECLSSAIAIITELKHSLDPAAAPALGANLGALYGYCLEGLLEVNKTNNIQKLDEVASLIRTVKEGFDGIQDPAEKSQG